MKIIEKEFNEAWQYAKCVMMINTFSKKEIAKLFFERGRKNGLLWSAKKQRKRNYKNS